MVTARRRGHQIGLEPTAKTILVVPILVDRCLSRDVKVPSKTGFSPLRPGHTFPSYSSSTVKFAFVKMQISLAIRMAS
jgi:hypothetical protein